MASFGCKSFAILFDDIDIDMCEADKQVFQSFAHAQVSVTNEVYQHLGEPAKFFFCPTGEIHLSFLTGLQLFSYAYSYLASIVQSTVPQEPFQMWRPLVT